MMNQECAYDCRHFSVRPVSMTFKCRVLKERACPSRRRRKSTRVRESGGRNALQTATEEQLKSTTMIVMMWTKSHSPNSYTSLVETHHRDLPHPINNARKISESSPSSRTPFLKTDPFPHFLTLLLQVLLILLRLLPRSPSLPVPLPSAMSPSSEEDGSLPSWLFVLLTIATTFPWAIVPICDAIDSKYRTIRSTALRLLLSSILLTASYGAACIVIIDKGVHSDDESIAIIVLLIFNAWYVLRNIRGWLQFYALRRFIPAFTTMQASIHSSFPAHLRANVKNGIHSLLVSERLVDNDFASDTPFLQPFSKRSVEQRKPERTNMARKYSEETRRTIRNSEIFAVATWKAWWTQNISILEDQHELAAESLKCSSSHQHIHVENLEQSGTGKSPDLYLQTANDFTTLSPRYQLIANHVKICITSP